MGLMSLKHKKVALLGFGMENQALLPYLESQEALITICDRHEGLERLPNYDYRLGQSYLDNLTDFELVFRTPGLPYQSRPLQEARQAGVIISSQTKLFFALCPAQIIGVTGTKGKGTTSSLLTHILTVAGQAAEIDGQIFLAGNIGRPMISLLPQLTASDTVILELSSFQLEDLTQSPHVAVVLNVTSDHLDHHRDATEYIAAKKNIVRYQKPGDYLVVNLDSLTSRLFAEATPAQTRFFSRFQSVDVGVFVSRDRTVGHPDGRPGDRTGGLIIVRHENEPDQEICPTKDVALIGDYNLENVTAAATAADIVGASLASLRTGLTTFRGLPHRLEWVAEIKAVRYYDDSNATTPDSAIAALLAFTEPVILIVGGSPKGADFAPLIEAVAASMAKAVIAIGQEGQRIADLLEERGLSVPVLLGAKSMDAIVKQAADLSRPGDIVLLSPAAASFDMFKNAADRGEQFQHAVKQLSG